MIFFLLHSESKRIWAANKIIQLREEKDDDEEQIRLYKVPKLNPNAESYDQMIDWDNEELFEPRPTMSITNTDLLKIGSGEKKLQDFIPKIICHSQRNEFAVQDTSKTVKFEKTQR